MGKWGKRAWINWGNHPNLSHFSPIFLPFPVNFTHAAYVSQNVFLAIFNNSPFPPNFPHFPKPLRQGG